SRVVQQGLPPNRWQRLGYRTAKRNRARKGMIAKYGQLPHIVAPYSPDQPRPRWSSVLGSVILVPLLWLLGIRYGPRPEIFRDLLGTDAPVPANVPPWGWAERLWRPRRKRQCRAGFEGPGRKGLRGPLLVSLGTWQPR